MIQGKTTPNQQFYVVDEKKQVGHGAGSDANETVRMVRAVVKKADVKNKQSQELLSLRVKSEASRLKSEGSEGIRDGGAPQKLRFIHTSSCQWGRVEYRIHSGCTCHSDI